uniref:Uncharacterized protein n=1 Tax=Plectus sambesii TaxID=2011161 RepID=A0A914WPJ6_9BILA
MCAVVVGQVVASVKQTKQESQWRRRGVLVGPTNGRALNCPTNAAYSAKSTARQMTRPQINRQQISDAISRPPSVRFSPPASQFCQGSQLMGAQVDSIDTNGAVNNSNRQLARMSEAGRVAPTE